MAPSPRSQPASEDHADATLAAAGDARAFERLYRRHAGRIHGLALRMVGPAHSEELAQEIFVRCWQKLGSFEGRSQFGTWLYRLGVNHLLSRRTQIARTRDREVAGDDIHPHLPARAARVDERMDLEGALQRIPPGAREVFVLHDVEGFRHEEIGQMLGIASGTSKSQLHHARRLLREQLRGEARS